MKKITDIKKITENDWLKLRDRSIGSSDSGVIMGSNEYKCKMTLFLEKTGQLNRKYSSESILWGNLLETPIAEEFESRHKEELNIKDIFVNSFMLQHDDYDFITCNLDRVGIDKDGNMFVLEIKTAGEYQKEKWDNNQVPQSYIDQVQHQLMITGYKYAYIACLIGGNKLIYRKIEADYEYHKMMILEYIEFWNEYVLKNILPDPDGSEDQKNLLTELYPENTADFVHLPEHLNKHCERIINDKEQIKAMETEIRLHQNNLKDFLKNNEYAENDDFKISWKTNKNGSRVFKIKQY